MQPVQPMRPVPTAATANQDGARRRTTIVLTILVVVLVAAVGLFLTLFLAERGATAEVRDQITSTERAIATERSRTADTEAEVVDLEARGQTLTSDNDRMRTCVDASKESIRVALTGTDAELDQAIGQLLVDCPSTTTGSGG